MIIILNYLLILFYSIIIFVADKKHSFIIA